MIDLKKTPARSCGNTTHERECIQDLHPLIWEGICLHCNCNLNGLCELLRLIPISIERLWLSCLGASVWMVCGLDRDACLRVHNNCLGHCKCCGQSHIGNIVVGVSDLTLQKRVCISELLDLSSM